MTPPPFLMYTWNGWVFEFHGNRVVMTSQATGDQFELTSMSPYDPFPFVVMKTRCGGR